MFRTMITPIFRSARLCVTACGIIYPRCCWPAVRPATSWVHYTTSCNTQSSTPEDRRDHRPKHVELIGIINKPLLLHLVCVYIIYSILSLRLCVSCELFSAGVTKVHLNRNFTTLSLQGKMIIIPLTENEIPQARSSVL